jgi:hypothetical protein
MAVARWVFPPELVEGAGPADQDGVMGVLQELASVKLAHERLVDLATGEVEAGEVAIV